MLCWKYVLRSRCCRQSGQTRRKTYGRGETRTHDHQNTKNSWECFESVRLLYTEFTENLKKSNLSINFYYLKSVYFIGIKYV